VLVSRVDPRAMMSVGFASTAMALVYMSRHMTLGIDFETAALLRTLQTLGLAFIFIPSNTLAYVGIPQEKNNQVSAMNAFVRNVGGRIGIATIITFVLRQSQKHLNFMVAHASSGNPQFRDMIAGMSQAITMHGVDALQSAHKAYALMYREIIAQATTLAYVDVVSVLALVVACLTPLSYIMKRGLPGTGDGPMH